MIRSRVAFGMCLDDGALFKTADTVPGESPTDAATDLSVTAPPFLSAVFLSWLISPWSGVVAVRLSCYGAIPASDSMPQKALNYMATRLFRKFLRLRARRLMPKACRLNRLVDRRQHLRTVPH